MSKNDTIRVVDASSPEAINKPIQDTAIINVPNMSLYSRRIDLPEYLEYMSLPQFNPDLLTQICRVLREHLPLSTILNSESP